MVWKRRTLGLRFADEGDTDAPRFRLTVFSGAPLGSEYLEEVVREVRWRFNLEQDVSGFCSKYGDDGFLREPIRRWRGMKPMAANSLYEMLMIYVVLQNATVRRSVQMLENLFAKFGERVTFDGRTLSAFWGPEDIAGTAEEELRALKVGYRAKSIERISEQFARGEVDEFLLRNSSKETVTMELDRIYGVGPASLDGLLFDDFHFLDALETVPPWEQKITSRLLFGRRLVPPQKILRFFRSRYPGFEKLAFHYVWEDLFWRREHERIEWLEREIRL
jgi:3-methyladenine DNA glycosylase/8-oxoguanine DNA glycosylase